MPDTIDWGEAREALVGPAAFDSNKISRPRNSFDCFPSWKSFLEDYIDFEKNESILNELSNILKCKLRIFEMIMLKTLEKIKKITKK